MDRQRWDERYSGPEPAFPETPNPLVAEELAGVAPGRAVDLGCGEGRHTVWLASKGWRVVGVDFSMAGLRRARSRDQDAVLVQADVGRLPFADHVRFDLVLAAFYRTPSYPAVAVLVAPGGRFLQVSYDRDNLTEGTGGPRNPDHLIDRAQAAAELSAAGLRVERADKVRVGDAVDAVVRAVSSSATAGDS